LIIFTFGRSASCILDTHIEHLRRLAPTVSNFLDIMCYDIAYDCVHVVEDARASQINVHSWSSCRRRTLFFVVSETSMRDYHRPPRFGEHGRGSRRKDYFPHLILGMAKTWGPEMVSAIPAFCTWRWTGAKVGKTWRGREFFQVSPNCQLPVAFVCRIRS
jgi:hypothetical protein